MSSLYVTDMFLREKHGTYCPSEPQEGINSADTLISEFWPSNLWELVLALSHSVCDTLLQET